MNSKASVVSAAAAAAATSEQQWTTDLEAMLSDAKNRFADVVWATPEGTLLYGHKSIIYSRASGSFQQRYLGAPKAMTEESLAVAGLLIRSDPCIGFTSPASLVADRNVREPLSLGGTDPALFQACLEYLCESTEHCPALELD